MLFNNSLYLQYSDKIKAVKRKRNSVGYARLHIHIFFFALILPLELNSSRCFCRLVVVAMAAGNSGNVTADANRVTFLNSKVATI